MYGDEAHHNQPVSSVVSERSASTSKFTGLSEAFHVQYIQSHHVNANFLVHPHDEMFVGLRENSRQHTFGPHCVCRRNESNMYTQSKTLLQTNTIIPVVTVFSWRDRCARSRNLCSGSGRRPSSKARPACIRQRFKAVGHKEGAAR